MREKKERHAAFTRRGWYMVIVARGGCRYAGRTCSAIEAYSMQHVAKALTTRVGSK
mgnify:CR=1 FL=1